MQASRWFGLVVFASLCTAIPAAAQPPVGALAVDERQGDQWGWAVDYETASAAQERALGECGSGCSVVLTFGRCAAYASDQDADSTAVGLGRSVCHRLCRAAVGAVRVPFARRRFGLHRSGVGLQRPGGRGGAEPGLGGAAPDPAGPGGRGFRSRRCGRPVRSADACGDTAVAVVTRWAGDRLSGRCVGRSAAVYRCGRSGGDGGRSVCAWGGPRGAAVFAGALAGRLARGERGVGRLVLAVDHEQHEPCGVRGVSASVPERAVQRAGGRRVWRRCACRRVLRPRQPGRVWAGRGRREPPVLGFPARLRRPLAQQPAGTCAGVPARCSGTARSAP